VRSVAFSPDGQTLAWGVEDGVVYLYDMKNSTLLQTLSGHTDWVESLAFSPDGRTMASGGLLTACLWNVSTGALLHTLSGHFLSVNSLAFAPDGLTLASVSMDEKIRLWDTSTGRLITTLVGHTDSIHNVAYSPDGRTLASASDDGSLRLWDPSTMACSCEHLRDTPIGYGVSPFRRTVRSWHRGGGMELYACGMQPVVIFYTP
jgi:WD40 repeat protein